LGSRKDPRYENEVDRFGNRRAIKLAKLVFLTSQKRFGKEKLLKGGELDSLSSNWSKPGKFWVQVNAVYPLPSHPLFSRKQGGVSIRFPEYGVVEVAFDRKRCYSHNTRKRGAEGGGKESVAKRKNIWVTKGGEKLHGD